MVIWVLISLGESVNLGPVGGPTLRRLLLKPVNVVKEEDPTTISVWMGEGPMDEDRVDSVLVKLRQNGYPDAQMAGKQESES